MAYPEPNSAFLEWDLLWLHRIHTEWSPDFLNPLWVTITHSGLGHIKLLFLLPFMIWRKTRFFGIACFFGGLVAGFFNLIAKAAVDRWRPGRFPDLVEPLDVGIVSHSFPSGHTTSSFGIAFMLLFLLKGTRYAWVSWAAIVWSLAVGYSRIYVGVHWPSDALAGIAFGALGASVVGMVYHRYGLWTKSETDAEPSETS